MSRLWVLAALCLLAGCAEKAHAPAAPGPRPSPLEPLIAERLTPSDGGEDRETLYRVKPFTWAGEAPPEQALAVATSGTALKLAGVGITLEGLKSRLTPQIAVVLSFDDETYLAQIAPLLATLDEAGAKVWLQSPDVPTIGWPVRLCDEPTFANWLDEPVAGKLRVVQRSDGFELQTNLGKLPGGDPKGPTVPARGGALDLVTLQKGLDQVKARFRQAPDLCFMPSYATTARDATRAVASNWLAADKVVFSEACLVYPRPKK